MKKIKLLERLEGGLIVSCQAETDEPLGTPEMITALAQSAANGGAAGIRANLPVNIRAVKNSIDLPLIGIFKKEYPDSDVFITATTTEIAAVAKSGADILAMDATLRQRPASAGLADLVTWTRQNYDIPLMADISMVDEGLNAADLGFDMVGTTLSGYTEYTRSEAKPYEPDFTLIAELAKKLPDHIPLIAEGRIWDPEHAVQAFDHGAFAVVVGSAITRPHLITRRFSEAILNARH